MCFERPKKKSIKPTQCRSSVIQTTHHRALHDLGLRGLLNLNNQSKHRHVASIVHYPIKTPPRAFYCALPNQTPPRFSIVHFAAQEKKKLKSNVFYNSSPYGARVTSSQYQRTLETQPADCDVVPSVTGIFLIVPGGAKRPYCHLSDLGQLENPVMDLLFGNS